MPKFDLSCSITVSAVCTVEADTLEEAIEAAADFDCRYDCPGSIFPEEDETWIVSEIDGSPKNIKAD